MLSIHFMKLKLKKLFLNICIFFLLISSFFYFYFQPKKTSAEGLSSCIKNDYSSYITINSNVSCPDGYFLAPEGFNLNLLPQDSGGIQYTSTSSNSTTSNSNVVYGGDPYYTINPYQYPNTSSTSISDNYGYPYGQQYGQTYGTYGGQQINFDPNQQTTGYVYNQNPNNTYTQTVNQGDLQHGRFENLDPVDYKYCVLLTRDLSIGASDANSGREVSALQMYLYDRGYSDIPANGLFDQNTFFAVQRFEYRNQIKVDGVVDSEFRSILKELTCVKYPVISYFDKPISPSPVVAEIYTNSYNSNNNTTYIKPPTPASTPISSPSTANNSQIKIPDTNAVKVSGPASISVAPSSIIVQNQTTTTSTLIPISGNMFLSKGNILYFTYNTKSLKPFFCITLNNTDCENNNNYSQLDDGIFNNYFEAINLENY